MVKSVIDPVSRIEGHLRIEMEVTNGKVSEAWVSGGLFRGMELVLEGRRHEDAVVISQRICGVCPVSHAHAAAMAGEQALGITIPNGARIIRNIIEAAQFLHSHILWFYNLAGLDYVNPLNALNANIADTYDLAQAAKTTTTDFATLQNKLKTFAENKQLSIFSGNWFDTGEYILGPELDLIATAHYLEALDMQATASEISGIIGGKMPHIITSVTGGTNFIPTEEKLDEILYKAIKIRDWVQNTMLPDTLAIAPVYKDAFGFGQGVGRFLAWGVFENQNFVDTQRYLPAGIVSDKLELSDPDESLIKEYTGRSYYATSSNLNPREGLTDPEWPEGGYNINEKYTWCKAPRYDGLPYEAGGLSRLLVAYLRKVPRVVELIDSTLKTLGHAGKPEVLISTMGRTGGRNLETLYVAELLVEWVNELIEAIGGAGTEYFAEQERSWGHGSGMWEAPRGALYHYMDVEGDRINKYQIIIPSTWNISPRDENGVRGPMEEALIGNPIANVEKPINALRTVHSFDPCVACAIHVSEPQTGKHFETVINPWGVK